MITAKKETPFLVWLIFSITMIWCGGRLYFSLYRPDLSSILATRDGFVANGNELANFKIYTFLSGAFQVVALLGVIFLVFKISASIWLLIMVLCWHIYQIIDPIKNLLSENGSDIFFELFFSPIFWWGWVCLYVFRLKRSGYFDQRNRNPNTAFGFKELLRIPLYFFAIASPLLAFILGRPSGMGHGFIALIFFCIFLGLIHKNKKASYYVLLVSIVWALDAAVEYHVFEVEGANIPIHLWITFPLLISLTFKAVSIIDREYLLDKHSIG